MDALDSNGVYFHMTLGEDHSFRLDAGGQVQEGTWKHDGFNDATVTVDNSDAKLRLSGGQLVFEQGDTKITCSKWTDKPADADAQSPAGESDDAGEDGGGSGDEPDEPGEGE